MTESERIERLEKILADLVDRLCNVGGLTIQYNQSVQGQLRPKDNA